MLTYRVLIQFLIFLDTTISLPLLMILQGLQGYFFMKNKYEVETIIPSFYNLKSPIYYFH